MKRTYWKNYGIQGRHHGRFGKSVCCSIGKERVYICVMQGKFSLYVFDLDGTLIDSSPGIIKAARHTLKQFGKVMPDDKTLASFIGPPLKTSFSLLPDTDEKETEEMVTAFRKEYREKEILNARLYDGVLELCQRLSNNGIKLAIATNKPEEFAQRLIKHFQLYGLIHVICGADMKGTLQKADLIKKAMALSEERDVESVVMVGDTIGDAKAAEACGIAFIGVSYGFGRLEKPLIKNMVKLADKPEDIYINL